MEQGEWSIDLCQTALRFSLPLDIVYQEVLTYSHCNRICPFHEEVITRHKVTTRHNSTDAWVFFIPRLNSVSHSEQTGFPPQLRYNI